MANRMEGHRPAQHQFHGMPQYPRRCGSEWGMHPGPELVAESRTEKSADHPYLLGGHAEHCSQHIPVVHDSLGRLVQRQLVTVPDGKGGVRLDGIVRLRRYDVALVNSDLSACEAIIGVT